jgi:protein-disulfide isomerase
MESQKPLPQEVKEPEEQLRLKKEMLEASGGMDKSKLLLPVSIVVGALIISGTILYTASNSSRGSDKAAVGQLNGNAAGEQARLPNGSRNVSVDDDPVLGDQNAPLTIIEFSDYECPFCKRSFDQVLPDLKKHYIDTGKVKLVYRDFPLSFHANAHKEAQAAECARDQGGDTAYFKFHDQIFTQTTANGTGLALTQLPVIAKNLGLNVSQFQQCLDSGKFKDEVDKDIADGIAAGVSGTPSWFIGKSSKDGFINGTLVVGAQPFPVFKTVIDSMLANLN